MLLLKRMRQRALVFVALCAVVAVACGVSVGIVGYLGASESQGVRSQLAQRTGADLALQLSLPTATDPAAQSANVDRLLASVFRDGDREFGLSVTPSYQAAIPVPLSTGVRAYVASVPDLESRATLVDGAWPATAAEASVQADAAAALGLSPGDELGVGDITVTITATWRVSDPLDPRWVGDPRFLYGIDSAVSGPIILDREALTDVGTDTRSVWAVVPDVAAVRSGDLDIYIQGWRDLADSMRADGGLDVDGLKLTGGFASSATSARSTVEALGAVAPVILLVIAAIVMLTLVELGQLIATLRASEWLLLWSRGDTVSGLTANASTEAGVVAALGSALGTGASVVILGLDLTLLGPALWAVPLAATVVATVAFGTSTLLAARSIARRDATEEGGRLASASSIAVPVLLTIAAGISTWQLLLYGSPLTPSRDGGTQIDPIAVVAPALALLALVTLALAALPLVRRPLDRRTDRSVSLGLVARTFARRTRLLVPPLVLCALACGQLTLAAGYAQTWDTAYTLSSELRAGSELTVTNGAGRLTESVLTQLRQLDEVTVVAPVYSEQVAVGETSASLVALTPLALETLAAPAGGAFDSAATAALITVPFTGPVLPEGTTEVEFSTEANSDVAVDMSIVVADEFGAQYTLPTSGNYRAELPEGRGEWRVLAFVVTLPSTGPTQLSVTELSADGNSIELGTGWASSGFTPQVAEVETTSGPGFRGADGLTSVRISPMFGPQTDDVRPPVVVSKALAENGGIRVGDVVPLTLDPRLEPFPCVVAAILDAVPGAPTESAVMVDGSLVQAVRARVYAVTPTPEAAWLGTDDSIAALPAVRQVVGDGADARSLSVDPDRGILGSAATVMWVGAAAAGILALIALIAVVGAQLQSRRGEIVVLRALGVSDRELATGRRAELGIALAIGAVVGVVSGAIVTLVTIPALARAAVPGSYGSLATGVGIQPGGLGLGLVTLGLGCGAILLAYSRRVVR